MTDAPKQHWYRLTPDRFLVGLLIVVAVLYLSERFFWFPFNEHKGYTVLIAVATVAAAFVLLLLWCGVALLFRRRFQFGLRSLLVLVTACAIVSGWFTVRLEEAQRQRETVSTLEEAGAVVFYGYQVDDEGANDVYATLAVPDWAVQTLGVAFFEDVVRIDVHSSEFGDDDMIHLTALSNLSFLYLIKSETTDAGLAQIKQLRQLERLSLVGTQFTDEGLVYLKELTGLKTLVIGNNTIGDAGLLQLKEMHTIHFLFLKSTQITDDGLLHLKEMRSLDFLFLDETQITDVGLKQLAELTKLKSLGLRGFGVTGPGLAHLHGLAKLEDLWLDKTPLTDAGLAQLKGMTSLHMLRLTHTAITDDGLQHLTELRHLESLTLFGTQIDTKAVDDLQRSLPNCKMYQQPVWEP